MDERDSTGKSTDEQPGDVRAGGAPEAEVSSAESVDDMTRQLQEWQAKAEDYLDKYRRSVAEFANYRKRQERERDQERLRLRMDAFALILPVADDLQRATSLLSEDDTRATWAEGVAMIERKLLKILGDAGVVPIEALGKPFDPHYHSAVMRQESDEYAEGVVMSELQRGYLMGDTVLRPAMVVVSGGPGRGNRQEQNSTSHEE